MSWRTGPAEFEYNGQRVQVPEGVYFATDGSTWLYGNGGSETTNETRAERCRASKPNGNALALLSPMTCRWVPHPGLYCESTNICDLAQGHAPPGGVVKDSMTGDPTRFTCAGSPCHTLDLRPDGPAWALELFVMSEIGGRVEASVDGARLGSARVDPGKNLAAFVLFDGWTTAMWHLTFHADEGSSGDMGGLLDPRFSLIEQPLPCPPPDLPVRGNVTREEAIELARQHWSARAEEPGNLTREQASLVGLAANGTKLPLTPLECREPRTSYGVDMPDGRPHVVWSVSLSHESHGWGGTAYITYIDSTTGDVLGEMRVS